MPKAIFIMLLALVSKSAVASWVEIGHSDAYTAYADPATIRKSGDRVKMWSLYDYKKALVSHGGDKKPYLSQKTQYEYDCKQGQKRMLAYSLHSGNMGTGDVVVRNSEPYKEIGDSEKWWPVVPESMAQSVWKYACGKK